MRRDLEKLSETGEVRLSRRRLLGNAMLGAAAMAGGALAAANDTAAKDKISKTAAHYQDRPNKGQRCGGCTHFLFGGCALVAGSISSNGWCKLFKASA